MAMSGMCVLMIFCLLKTKLQFLPESVACVIVGEFCVPMAARLWCGLCWRDVVECRPKHCHYSQTSPAHSPPHSNPLFIHPP